jgi:hypothetical protein
MMGVGAMRERVFEQAWMKVQRFAFVQVLGALQTAGAFSIETKTPSWPGSPAPGKRGD